jgi:hypothetical protein
LTRVEKELEKALVTELKTELREVSKDGEEFMGAQKWKAITSPEPA